MGRLTLVEFEDEVRMRLGDSGIVPTRLRRWINLAIEEMSTAMEHELMKDRYFFSTVADQRDYDYPDGFVGFETMEDVTNKRTIIYTDAENLQRLDREETGQPKLWTMKGDTLTFWPTPDGVFEVEAVAVITLSPLTSPGDKTTLHSRWDNAVIFLATHYGADALKHADAEKWMKRYLDYMRSRMTDDDYRRNNISTPVTIARSWEDITHPRTDL